MRALQGSINGVNGSLAAAGATAAGVGFLGNPRQMSGLTKFGNQLQWTGRQLQYNFTLPIALAGIAATNFAMDNERAFTRIAKVYGDTTLSAEVMKNELNALREAFEALSNHYGVHQKEVLAIAADWAAAGASGVALARGVEQTLRVMVLGEMEAAAATEALIAIQAQYNLSSAELVDTLAKLNVIENQTAISMQGLVQGFQRAAGVARSAGVDVNHLGAMLAALVPAAGTAAQAGNALKTILSRLMSPTARAAEVMKEMGINLNDTAWQSANGAQRLEILAQKFHGLADSQRAVVSETIASRYQINKFEILMDQIFKASNDATRGQSRYAQALDATRNRSKYLAQAEKELRAVLESNPQKMKQIWVILQNAMADIIVPMIPIILMAARALASLAEAFRSLPPEVQKAITFFLLFLALFGPLLRYMGSTMTLIGELAWFFGGLGKAVLGAGKAVAAFLLFPFSAIGGAIGSMAGGLARLSIAAVAAARSMVLLLFAGPLMGRMFAAMGAIVSRAGSMIIAIWMTSLARMAAVTAPLLAAVTGVFGMWMTGVIRLMTALRVAMFGGWLTIVAASRFVGPAILASMRTMWTALIALWTVGTTAIVARTRAMWLLVVAFFANWRIVLVRMVTLMWAGIIAVFRGGIVALGRMLLTAAAALIGPWGIAIAAILAVVYFFRDQIGQAIRNTIEFFQNMPAGIVSAFQPIVDVFHAAVAAVMKGFNALPKGVRDAMIAVVNIVASAVRQVYELFSYLNPFAHHSPSLVENVTNGMAVIKKQFASITDIEGPIKSAYREIKAFGEATKKLLNGMDTARRAEDRSNLAQVAPGALNEFDALVRRIMQLTVMLNKLKTAVDAQQSVVDGWKKKLDAANAALDVQETKLRDLQKTLDVAKDNLNEAQDALQNFTNTPLVGMKAFEDQIFANEMAQKRLRLEMLRMEEAGEAMDDLQSKAEAMAGMIEMLSGEQAHLRDLGAGSEILNVYDQEISKIEEQQRAINDQASEYAKLSDELERLQRQGEILDLEKSLQFDELIKQINDAANATKELTFEEIMAGIQKTNAEIAKYSAEVDKANKAVEDQQKVVDAATKARDEINKRYDAEVAKLDQLQAAYDKVNQTIQDINSSLQDMASAAADAIQRAKDAAGGAGGALGAAGDFPEVGGAGGLGREGGLGDQSALIDQFTKDLAMKTGDLLGGFDLFGPVKKKFNELKGWFSANVGPVFGAIGEGFQAVFGGIDWMAPFKKIDWSFLQTIWDTGKDIFQTAVDWIMNIVKLFSDDFKEIWDTIWNALKDAWKEIGPEVAEFKELLGPLAQLFKQMWTIVKPLAAVIGVVLLGALKIVSSVLVNVLKPVLGLIIDIIKAVIKVIRGLLEFVVGVFTGDWELAWKGVKDIFSGIWDAIWGILKGAVGVIWGIVSGLVEGIVDFFKWLYDVLVGHSIIPDMVNAIIEWIGKLPGMAWEALKDLGTKIVDQVKKAWDMFVQANKAAWGLINTWFKGRPQAAWDAIIAIRDTLRDVARRAFDYFFNGAKERWEGITTWFKGRRDAVVGYLGNVKDGLKAVATTAINYFRDGASNAWGNVKGWFEGRASAVRNAVGNISLYNIGKSILQSLLDGMRAAWQNTKDFLSSLGGQIKNLKGPIEKDKKLLIPEGKAIIDSLGVGMEGQWPELESWLKTVAPGIRDAIVSGVSTATPVGLKSAAMARVGGSLMAADARIGATQGEGGTVQTGNEYGTRNEYHFHGDLSFPNIENAGDAEEFLRNLEAIVRG